jgi:hypothetical protein
MCLVKQNNSEDQSKFSFKSLNYEEISLVYNKKTVLFVCIDDHIYGWSDIEHILHTLQGNNKKRVVISLIDQNDINIEFEDLELAEQFFRAFMKKPSPQNQLELDSESLEINLSHKIPHV